MENEQEQIENEEVQEVEDTDIRTGKVKWFNPMRGFGFIEQTNGQDFFIHHSGIIMDGFKKLNDGDSVTFEVDQDDQGRTKAINVKIISD